jgi:HTH-type transcriptional regulator/antitoxin HigA
MLSPNLVKVVQVWPQLSQLLFVPRTAAEYERTVAWLDELIDEVGEDENHPLSSLMETLGSLIESYENSHFPEPMGSPITSLQEFMADYNLGYTDLPELGDETVVREILQGKRDLTLAQVRFLAQRFGVTPALFV